MTDKNEYIQRMQATLEQWNAEIDVLSAKADVAEAEARARYLAQIESLRNKRSDAGRRLDELKSAGEGAWHDMKAGVESAWSALAEAVDAAKSRFG